MFRQLAQGVMPVVAETVPNNADVGQLLKATQLPFGHANLPDAIGSTAATEACSQPQTLQDSAIAEVCYKAASTSTQPSCVGGPASCRLGWTLLFQAHRLSNLLLLRTMARSRKSCHCYDNQTKAVTLQGMHTYVWRQSAPGALTVALMGML